MLTVLIFVLAVLIESFRKAILIELPWVSKYEQELEDNIQEINNKNIKLLKEVTKLITKDKPKSTFSPYKKLHPSQDAHSQILDDDELLSVEIDKKSEKILIVYEIHNTYLEEIKRYNEKKDTHQPIFMQKRA